MLVVAVELGQMMGPLQVALDRHFTKGIGSFYFDDAHTTCSLWVSEDESIGGGTPDLVSEHPELCWFHDTIGHVLIRSDRHRLVIQSPLMAGTWCRFFWV